MAKMVEQDRKGSSGGQEGPDVNVPLFSRTIKILMVHAPRHRDYGHMPGNTVSSVFCDC